MKTRISVTAVVSAIILAVILCVAAVATDIPSPTKSFYVCDEANVIDKSVESYIIDKSNKLNSHTGAQIVIVTVDSTGDTPIKDYASEIFNEWKIGDSSAKNGLLILLAIDDENYWVAQGNGIQDRLTTSSIKTILDSYLEPYFASGNYSKGVQTVFDKFLESFEKIYSVNIDEEVLAKAENNTDSSVFTVVAIIVAIVVFVVIIVILVKRFNTVGRYISNRSQSRRSYRTGYVQRVNAVQPSRKPRSTARTSSGSGGRKPVSRPASKPSAASRRPSSMPVARPGAAARPRPQSRSGSPSNKSGQR